MKQNMLLAGLAVVLSLAGIGAYELFFHVEVSRLPPGAPLVGFTPVEFRTQYRYEMDGLSLEELSPERRAAELRHKEWREHGIFRKLTGDINALVEAWAPTVLDPTNVLDEKQRSDILHLLARHAVARAQDTPAQYIDLIETSETSHWNPDVADTLQLGVFYDFFAARTMNPSMDTMEMLRDVWSELKKYDHLFEAVGAGEKSSAFVAKRLPEDRSFDSRNLAGDGDYWMTGANRAGIRFSEANRTIDDVLAEHPSVLRTRVHSRAPARRAHRHMGEYMVLRSGHEGVDAGWHSDGKQQERLAYLVTVV